MATGVIGLDDILRGGLPVGRTYLVQGKPGVGKTTLALHFLLEGVRQRESVLYFTLSETEEEIRQIADSHDLSLDGVSIKELSSAEQIERLDGENTLYASEDVELGEVSRTLLAEIERKRPSRLVIDSMSELRALSQTGVRFRREVLRLKQKFAALGCTVLLLDEHGIPESDQQVESIAHGVLRLEQLPNEYGADRRRLRVMKLRGVEFRSGYHDFVVKHGGLTVFPRLVAAEHRSVLVAEPLPSGLEHLDTLLGGGIDCATSTLVMGPEGCGKSVFATQFAVAASKRGQRVAVFAFEERLETLLYRSAGLGLSLEPGMADGSILLKQVDPSELAPDEFTHDVRRAVEERDVKVIVIDSLNGYMNAMPGARYLMLQLHELLSYLGERGVASILTVTQTGVAGAVSTAVDVSYLADTIVMLRYFESAGRVRRAISVVKKRTGKHEDSIREFGLGPNGVAIGEPLSRFSGVLSGVPRYSGSADDLQP